MRSLIVAATVLVGLVNPAHSQTELEFYILAEGQARQMAPTIGWGYECDIPETSQIRLTFAKTMRLLNFSEAEMRVIDAIMTSYVVPGKCDKSSKSAFGDGVIEVLRLVTEWHDKVAANEYVQQLQ